jgi:hypothetical protein
VSTGPPFDPTNLSIEAKMSDACAASINDRTDRGTLHKVPHVGVGDFIFHGKAN